MKNKLEFLTDEQGYRWEKWQAADRTHYKWDKYNIESQPIWKWNKYNADSNTEYQWDTYAIHTDRQYTWDKYNAVSTYVDTDYSWEKHEAEDEPCYPSWQSNLYYKDDHYIWDKYGITYDETNPVYHYWVTRAANGATYSEEPNYQEDVATTKIGVVYLAQGIIDISSEIAGKNHYWGYTQAVPCWQGVYARLGGSSTSRKPIYTADILKKYLPIEYDSSTYGLGGLAYDIKSHSEKTMGYYLQDNDRFSMGPGSVMSSSNPELTGQNPAIATTAVFGCAMNRSNYNNIAGLEKYANVEVKIYDHPPVVRNAVTIEDALNDQTGLLETISDTFNLYTRPLPEINDRLLYYFLNHESLYILITVTNADQMLHPNYSYLTIGPTGRAIFKVDRGCECKTILTPAYSQERTYYAYYVFSPLYTWRLGFNDLVAINRTYEVDPTNYMGQIPLQYDLVDDNNVEVERSTQVQLYGEKVFITAAGYTHRGPYMVNGTWEVMRTTTSPTKIVDYKTAYKVPNQNQVFYTLMKTTYEPVWIKDEDVYYGEVSSTSSSTYPLSGVQSGYWYDYKRVEEDVSYIPLAVFVSNVDTSQLTRCTTASFNLKTGVLSYTAGNGDYYVNTNDLTYYYSANNYGYSLYTIKAIELDMEIGYGNWAGALERDSGYRQQTDTILKYNYYMGLMLDTVVRKSDTLPHDGMEGEYWYVYKGSHDNYVFTKSTYIGEEDVLNDKYYPDDAYYDGYWYTYKGYLDIKSAGQKEGSVTSIISSAYPINGIHNNLWYRYVGLVNVYSRGTFIEEVVSTTDSTAYPQDGMQNYYWYTFTEHSIIYEKVGDPTTVDSTDNQKFPQDGIVGSYWYVYDSSYTSSDPVRYVEEVWGESSSDYPHDTTSEGYYYKYLGLKYIPQYIIGDSLLKGGVKYKQDVNSAEDYAPGDVACAQIEYTIYSDPLDAQKYLDLECDYYERMEDTDSWNLVGHFIITDADDKVSTTTKMLGYDNILKTEIDVDYVINSQVTYPISLANLFTTICTACGVQGVWDLSAVNDDFSCQNNFTINGITGRQVLSLIAEVAAAFIYADKDGNIVCRGYATNDSIAIDETKHTDSSQGIYTTQNVDKLNVAMSTDDVGTSVGSGDVIFRIIGNPLLYAENPSEISIAMTNIYNVLHNSSYTPTTVKIIDPSDIGVGDIIDVNGQTVWVQGISWDGSGVTIDSKGKRIRTIPTNPIDGSIDALRGKSNELTRTIEQTNSRITSVQEGLQSEITQTASTLNSRITSEKAALQSEITQTAGSVTSTVEAYTDSAVAAAKTEIKQTTDSISSTVQSQGQTITSIQQDLNGISLTYNSSTGTASITIGDVTVNQLTDSGYVQRQIAGIDLTGYVTFHSLETYGETVINGSNITTGTINASRINMTGAISWSDLDSNVQDMITDGGGGGSDIPSYIHSTYISSTSIYSPNIYGAIITAGTSADGYIQMASKGMNFVSSTGGSLIGMGYYSSYYNMPYITLGQGVDSIGTDKGLIKKFQTGLWIGDSDCIDMNLAGPGTGIYINFNNAAVYLVKNGVWTEL